MNNTSNELWFRRKIYGWGWFPITWQGWLVIALYVVAIITLALVLLPKNGQEFPGIFIASVAILTIVLIVICYKKGEKPRWQWGNGGKK